MSPARLTGQEALDLIESQLSQHADGILNTLAQFEARASASAWLETLRAIEELINLPGELDDDLLERELLGLSLRGETFNSRRLKFVLHHLSYLYGFDFAQRQGRLILQL